MAANTPPGPGVDASGQAVIDPTANVLDLVQAAVRRLDDLADAEHDHIREVASLRAVHERELRVAEAVHSKELRMAEAARIDAIRAVDVGNVQRAAEVQTGVATALEGKVASTATAFESRLTATIEPIQRRIDDLTRAQYEAQGQKINVVDTQARGGNLALWIALGVSIVFGALATLAAATTIIITLMR